MKINLHIERLVLDGVNIAQGERHLLHASVTTEFTKLFNNNGLADNLVEGATLPRIFTGAIHIADNNPSHVGQKIAQSVYGGIGGE